MTVPHAFRDPRLLDQALTHPSYANEHPGTPDNQRFEFLGDAVVGLVVTEMLFEARPDWPEGSLHRARVSLVRTETFARLAEHLGLVEPLRVARGLVPSEKMRADAFEAVVGAVWLDGGLPAARAVLTPLFRTMIEELAPEAPIDARSRLQELAEARSLRVLVRHLGHEGPPHAPTFSAEVEVAGVTYGPGRGTSKRAAATAAAALALAALSGTSV